MLDPQGKLASWVQPQAEAYDRVVRLAWDYLFESRPRREERPQDLLCLLLFDTVNMRGTAWPHNPAGLYAMLADSAVATYAYSGDRKPSSWCG